MEDIKVTSPCLITSSYKEHYNSVSSCGEKLPEEVFAEREQSPLSVFCEQAIAEMERSLQKEQLLKELRAEEERERAVQKQAEDDRQKLPEVLLHQFV